MNGTISKEHEVFFDFDCDYCGCMRTYKSSSSAKRAAKNHAKKHEREFVSTFVEVYKTTFNPYTKTKIAEYRS